MTAGSAASARRHRRRRGRRARGADRPPRAGGGRARVTLVAPEPDFVYRPLSVAEPFCLGHATHYPLADVARDFDAELVRGEPRRDRPGGRSVTRRRLVGRLRLAAGGGRRRSPRGLRARDHVRRRGAPRRCRACWPTSRRATPGASRSSSRAAPRGACRSTSSRSSRPGTCGARDRRRPAHVRHARGGAARHLRPRGKPRGRRTARRRGHRVRRLGLADVVHNAVDGRPAAASTSTGR